MDNRIAIMLIVFAAAISFAAAYYFYPQISEKIEYRDRVNTEIEYKDRIVYRDTTCPVCVQLPPDSLGDVSGPGTTPQTTTTTTASTTSTTLCKGRFVCAIVFGEKRYCCSRSVAAGISTSIGLGR